MEIHEIESAVEGILFASGEPVSADRIASVLLAEREDVLKAASNLADKYAYERRGIRLVNLDSMLQMCSAPELSDIIRTALETRKPPRLSQPALEVLAIIAYFQPVTRAYIEQVRGVDSSYTVGLLHERGLIEPAGKLDAPGRPVLYRTTLNFLRTFGLSSLDELPVLEEAENEIDGQIRLQALTEAIPEAGTETGDCSETGVSVFSFVSPHAASGSSRARIKRTDSVLFILTSLWGYVGIALLHSSFAVSTRAQMFS